jgi:hypothetical protein
MTAERDDFSSYPRRVYILAKERLCEDERSMGFLCSDMARRLRAKRGGQNRATFWRRQGFPNLVRARAAKAEKLRLRRLLGQHGYSAEKMARLRAAGVEVNSPPRKQDLIRHTVPLYWDHEPF